jgi:ribosomal protein L15E
MASSTHRSLNGNKEHTQTTPQKQCSTHWRAAKESSVEETFEKKEKLNIYMVQEEVKKQNFNVILLSEHGSPSSPKQGSSMKTNTRIFNRGKVAILVAWAIWLNIAAMASSWLI